MNISPAGSGSDLPLDPPVVDLHHHRPDPGPAGIRGEDEAAGQPRGAEGPSAAHPPGRGDRDGRGGVRPRRSEAVCRPLDEVRSLCAKAPPGCDEHILWSGGLDLLWMVP